MRELTGLSIILVGASGGIGSATALRIAAPGVKIGICSIDQEGLDKLEAQLVEKGATVYSKYVDVTKCDQITAYMDECCEKFGGADILVNFSGLSITAKIDQLTEAGYDKVMDVNVKGMFFCTQAFVKHVDTVKGALVINFGSMASKRPTAGAPHYSAAKAAVNVFSQALAMQLKEKNVKFTVMNPGPTNTAFYEGRIPEEKRYDFMVPDDVAEVVEFIMKRSDRLVFHDIMMDSYGYFTR